MGRGYKEQNDEEANLKCLKMLGRKKKEGGCCYGLMEINVRGKIPTVNWEF